MSTLVPCDRCLRHIRVDHGSCPFCAAPIPIGFAGRAIPAATRRLDRLSLFTFATALSIGACSGGGGGDVNGDFGEGADASPAPSVDGGAKREGGSVDASDDVIFSAPTYGAPWPDDAGGPPDAKPPADSGTNPKDAGPADDGGAAPLYGLPAFDAG